MISQLLRQDRHPGLPWHDTQRKILRGATRITPEVPMAEKLKSMLGFIKLGLGLLVISILLMSAYALTGNIWSYLNQPIAKVKVLGDLGYIDAQALQKRIEPIVSTGFLKLDLDKLRLNLEKTPWIDHVEVERVWPNQVNINLFSKKPVARWGEDSLLNNAGDSFITKDIEKYSSLPLLHGPDYAQHQVMQQYQVLSQLLRPMELSIVSLSLSDRGSWLLTTNKGLEIVLGNDDHLNRMRRFTKAYHTELKDKISNIVRVDLRYSNGLAVAWRDPSLEIETKVVARQ